MPYCQQVVCEGKHEEKRQRIRRSPKSSQNHRLSHKVQVDSRLCKLHHEDTFQVSRIAVLASLFLKYKLHGLQFGAI